MFEIFSSIQEFSCFFTLLLLKKYAIFIRYKELSERFFQISSWFSWNIHTNSCWIYFIFFRKLNNFFTVKLNNGSFNNFLTFCVFLFLFHYMICYHHLLFINSLHRPFPSHKYVVELWTKLWGYLTDLRGIFQFRE